MDEEGTFSAAESRNVHKDDVYFCPERETRISPANVSARSFRYQLLDASLIKYSGGERRGVSAVGEMQNPDIR